MLIGWFLKLLFDLLSRDCVQAVRVCSFPKRFYWRFPVYIYFFNLTHEIIRKFLLAPQVWEELLDIGQMRNWYLIVKRLVRGVMVLVI